MYFKSSLNKSERSRIVWEKIKSLVDEYSKTKKMTFKTNKSDTVPHQKITLYPIDYIPLLKETVDNIDYIEYSDIILGKITKTRNICDFINESYYIKKINELEETIKKGNQIF